MGVCHTSDMPTRWLLCGLASIIAHSRSAVSQACQAAIAYRLPSTYLRVWRSTHGTSPQCNGRPPHTSRARVSRLGDPQSPYAESSAALDSRGDHQALQRGAGCQYRTTVARRQPVSSRPVLTRWLGHEQVSAKATRPAENRSGHRRGWHSSRLWHGIPPAGRPGL